MLHSTSSTLIWKAKGRSITLGNDGFQADSSTSSSQQEVIMSPLRARNKGFGSVSTQPQPAKFSESVSKDTSNLSSMTIMNLRVSINFRRVLVSYNETANMPAITLLDDAFASCSVKPRDEDWLILLATVSSPPNSRIFTMPSLAPL